MADGRNEDQSPDPSARVGMLLKGKWTVERLLGVGGMASVYLAVHRNGSRVAVKVLHAHLALHPDTLRRFLREGYLSNKVEHPDVVTVLDDDVAPDGAPFLVMELLDGCSLDSLLESRGPFALKQAVDIVSKVLDVLVAAHDKGIVHRDLKPANVFLLKNGAIKVLDFGIARLHETSTPHAATLGGTVLGTPAFMAPEQARGKWEDVDARSDLWAMGATLYMLLANRSVRDEAETINEALLYAMTKPVAPMAELLPSLPRALGSVIDRALAFDKAARWPTASTMKEALTRALESAATDTIVDAPLAGMAAADPMSTGAATPFGHVFTPAGGGGRLGPGGQLAGTTPSSMPPFSGPQHTSALPPSYGSQPPAPAPLFTGVHAPATPPPFARTPVAAATTGASGGPSKLAVAGGVALAAVLIAIVGTAFALSRDGDEPPRTAATSSAATPSANAPATAATVSAAPSADAPATASTAAGSPPAVPATRPVGPSPKPRSTPSAKNPLDQGRF